MRIFIPGLEGVLENTEGMKIMNQKVVPNGLEIETKLSVLFAFKVALMNAYCDNVNIEYIDKSLAYYDDIQKLDK